MSTKDMTKDDDSEESLISQFETTMTIRSTTNDPEDDISIDHTTFYNNTSYMRDQTLPSIGRRYEEIREEGENEDGEDGEEEEEDDDDNDQIDDSQMTLFKTKKPNKLIPNRSIKIKKERQSKSPSPVSGPPPNLSEIEAQYERILRPSKLIDQSLTKYHQCFEDFLNFNPQIEKESPKFKRETDKTLVVLSPFSAEHAFGRTWVTKSYLATIFERPQRLLAANIGISAALTMYPFFYKIINSTKKGSIFSSHVLKIHGRNWPKKLYELCLESHDKLKDNNLEVPEDWNTGDIYLIPKTINAVEGVIGTIETAVDALYKSKNDHHNHNLSFVVIRPPGHHSHACLPSGFCLLNNVHIGIEYAFENYNVSHVAILDIDLHHGDGSQDICWERAGFMGDYGKDEDDEATPTPARDEYGKRFASYPKVGYFSLHDIKSYPTELGYATKENIKNASTCIMDHDLNIWNVHLQEWGNEDEFYKHYQTKYVSILNRANQFLNQAKKQYELEYQQYLVALAKYNKYKMRPGHHNLQSTSTAAATAAEIEKPEPPVPFKPLIILSSGFDASEYENPQMQRHGINVPTSFYSKFTKDVVKLAKIHTNGKVVSFLEGGYADGALTTGIFSHLIGLTNNIHESNNDSFRDEVDESLWNPSWGTEQVMRELVKGCKKNWAPYKQPKSDITIWANEVIKLGRSMMPNAILTNHYIYDYKDQLNEESPPLKSRMVKDLIDTDSPLVYEPPAASEEERHVRHTRSYLKKLAMAQKHQELA